MYEALIENAEYDVDDDEGRANQDRCGRQGILKRLRVALEGSDDRARHPDVARSRRYCVYRLSERNAGLEVERQRDCRKLPLVVDRKGACLVRIDVDERGQRYGASRHRRLHIEPIKGGRVSLQLRSDLEDHRACIELSKVLGNLTLSIGIVQRIVDQLR